MGINGRRNLGVVSVFVMLAGGAGCGGGGGGVTPPVTTGTISGTVTSGSAGVPGAQIALSGGGNQTTGSTGAYSFGSVPAGSHTVTLTPPSGFELEAGQAAARAVTVVSGQTATANWAIRQSTGGPPQSVDVQLLASSFSPADVTVARGGTVRWVNAGDVAHTITPANAGQAGVWQNQNVPAQQNFTFSHTFPTAGTFNYSCTLHVGMTGVVRVP